MNNNIQGQSSKDGGQDNGNQLDQIKYDSSDRESETQSSGISSGTISEDLQLADQLTEMLSVKNLYDSTPMESDVSDEDLLLADQLTEMLSAINLYDSTAKESDVSDEDLSLADQLTQMLSFVNIPPTIIEEIYEKGPEFENQMLRILHDDAHINKRPIYKLKMMHRYRSQLEEDATCCKNIVRFPIAYPLENLTTRASKWLQCCRSLRRRTKWQEHTNSETSTCDDRSTSDTSDETLSS